MPKKKARTVAGPQTLTEAIAFFADEDNALGYLIERRWPGGEVSCPTCNSTAVIFLKNQRRWKCANDHPRKQFSAKVGTIMEDSPLPIGKWLAAMWMISNCKNGISSYELHRALDITQKSAWFVLHRVRLAMQGSQGSGTLGGEIEVDETYVGGKARFMSKERKARKLKGRGTAGKAIVQGMLQRHGKDGVSRVKTRVISNTSSEILQGNVRRNVEQGSTLYTDEHGGYQGLDADYEHNVINHMEAYVRDNVHTNGIENFWTLLKRSIKGTYVSVEPFHLFRYSDEQAFRFNQRKDTDAERHDRLVAHVAGKKLSYKELIGEKAEPLTAVPA